MKHIVVTGGAGFIGSNLIERLFNTQLCRIVCVDSLASGYKHNIEKYLGTPNFKFVHADICDFFYKVSSEIEQFLFDEELGKVRVDEIYNFACVASPQRYQYDPFETLNTCIAVKYLCVFAMRYNAMLLHSSTSEVYGEPLMSPQPETYRGNVNPIGERSCYDEGKRVAETYLYEYWKRGCNVKLIRIFNTYGDHMDENDGRVVSNFICQALQNKDITIYGDGTQSRSFQYIDDLLDGIEALMEKGRGRHEVWGPYNLGNPHEFNMLELVQKILEKIPESTSKIVYKELPKDDPTNRKPDITKAQTDLGWTPKVQLSEGLDKTIEHFKRVLNH